MNYENETASAAMTNASDNFVLARAPMIEVHEIRVGIINYEAECKYIDGCRPLRRVARFEGRSVSI